MTRAEPTATVTDEWRRAVAIKLRELRWSQRHLAEVAGYDPGTISKLLRPRAQGGPAVSAAAPAVARAVDVPLPSVADVDADLRDAMAVFGELKARWPNVYAKFLERARRALDAAKEFDD